jgi:hypothetical protein
VLHCGLSRGSVLLRVFLGRFLLLAAWGSVDPEADLDGSGTVDGGDLGLMLANWG